MDVGARRKIHDLICELAAGGMAIMLISSDLEEVLALSHRVLVMRNGKVTAQFAEPFSAELVLSAAFGESVEGLEGFGDQVALQAAVGDFSAVSTAPTASVPE